MESVISFIEKRLKLKVNRDKTKVQRYSLSSLLGFGFHTPRWKVWNIRVSKKSINRVKEKCRVITTRNNGLSEEARIQKLKLLIRGWINYISIAGSVKHQLLRLDSYVQNRLRICLWKQWKRPGSRFRQLCKLGIDKKRTGYMLIVIESMHVWHRPLVYCVHFLIIIL
ncbi:group II intron maturase-specific domain-containing protein [Chitinophaga sancti]|uniref:group II intron maturase-specific domain-containing protein n=1 Tax=Chitinophaga sancti TaxID=1004 RepID=UPI0039BE1E36